MGAAKLRRVEERKTDSELSNKNIHAIRKQKLEDLFKDDEIKYEQELSQLGLAFRRIRA